MLYLAIPIGLVNRAD